MDVQRRVDTTIHDCSTGTLHLTGDKTDDIEATTSVDNPSVPYELRVAARIVLAQWDKERVLRVTPAGLVVGQLYVANLGAGAGFKMGFCNDAGTCGSGTFDWKPNEEHLVVIESAVGGTKWSVDCVSLGSIPAVTLAVGTTQKTTVVFGKADANPIDGTIDDVSVTFRF